MTVARRRKGRRPGQYHPVPEEDFESALAGPEKPSTSGIIAPKKEPMDPDALWLWGRLRDFEKKAILERDFDDVVFEMTDAMRSDVVRLAGPVVRRPPTVFSPATC